MLGKSDLRRRLWVFVGVLGLGTVAGEGRAAPAGPLKGSSWALLIGCEKYQKANPLKYTINDVRQLAETLHSRGGYDKSRILEITDDDADPKRRPLRQELMATVGEWLKKPGPDDRIVVYFTGHGFRDADGKMYLAPLDIDPSNAATSGISVEWLREQIAACRAEFKLLVLDACHAGSEKDVEKDASLAPELLGEPFRNLEGVVTLASSKAEQKSQIWFDKQQSLFSYYLVQGLKGHADKDNNGQVDIDELYSFVFRNVAQTANARFSRPQTPVRIIRTGVTGEPVVVKLQPQGLRQILADMAETLADAIEERKLPKVGILEFTNDTKLGELLGADYGALGKWCAQELEQKLMDYGAGRFNVVDRTRLRRALQTQGFSIDDLGDPKALERLSANSGGMPVIALGVLRNRTGRAVNLQCKLLQTDSDEYAGLAGGTAMLNESEWAMLGRSVQVLPADRRPSAPSGDEAPKPIEDQVVERLDQRANGPHPLQDPKFPFRIWLQVRGKPVKGVFKGNDYFVPLSKGDVYEIYVENRSGQTVAMRLLVDGLNTLPEEEKTKGVKTMLWGQRVNLDEARAWELDPNYSTINAVRGFVTETGPQGKLKEFTVVDAEKSLAARQQFTDQIGLITAAFYTPKAGSRGLGTEAGTERDENIAKSKGIECGNLLGVVHIRYVDASAVPR